MHRWRRFGTVVVLILAGATQGCATSSQSTTAATNGNPESRAVRAVIEDFAGAFNDRDLDRMLSHLAEDARIDSILAGGKVSKASYREAMMKSFAGGQAADRVELRRLEVTFPRGDAATVRGETYLLLRGGTTRGEYQRWDLEKRDGRWLIVETNYGR